MSEIDHGDHTHSGMDTGELSWHARRVRAMETVLAEQGVLTLAEVQRNVDTVESRSPADGARVVARAWADPEYKSRLLTKPQDALAQMGYTLPDPTPKLGVVENSDDVHHLVVCTLCSCYPRALLGRPPDWYKSFAYRSRAVSDPRGVLREFGTEVSDDTEVVVLDSTADLRYLVLPQRPAGTDGMDENELAGLVTRDSMIGVSRALAPEPVAADD
jgi:nitrile hydratase